MLLYLRKEDGADLSRSKDRSMDKEEKQAAKRRMMELMQAGNRWREAATQAGIQASRPTAYRWGQAYRKLGERALQEGRHGHRTKALERVLAGLEPTRKQEPKVVSRG